jgi:hypothetical protein
VQSARGCCPLSPPVHTIGSTQLVEFVFYFGGRGLFPESIDWRGVESLGFTVVVETGFLLADHLGCSPSTLPVIMKVSPQRKFFAIAFAILGLSNASAQVITIDWSDLSAVKFTTTSANSAISGGTGYTYEEGFVLLSFLQSTVVGQDIGTLVSSSLSDSVNTAVFFDTVSTWNAVDGPTTAAASGMDLTLWKDLATPDMVFSTASAAFIGELVVNLSGYSSITNLFPAFGATGSVEIWDHTGTQSGSTASLGTWEVVGASAVPEPSSYVSIVGVLALCGAASARRRVRQA